MARLSWANIPAEFASTGAWAVSTLQPVLDANGAPVLRGGKPVLDKAPRHPRTLALLDMHKPETWATFEECSASTQPAIGRLLQYGEGYTVIDIDGIPQGMDPEQAQLLYDFQMWIYSRYTSYAERSQSGSGCHIILLANLNGGYRQPGFEVYGHQRYMITTGDVIRGGTVTEDQQGVDELAAFMASKTVDYGLPEDEDDERSPAEIIEKASGAKNGAKFKQLFYEGFKEGDDWSALDAALAQMIAFWTKNHRLGVEVFAQSALWRGDGSLYKKRGYESPEKYVHDYLLGRTFARAWNLRGKDEAEEAERFAAGQKIAEVYMREAQIRADTVEDDGSPEVASSLPWPGGGLLADVANYILSSAMRPVPEVALAGAVAFLAGIAGRQFNISGSGLTQYIVLAADTGRGKEAAAAGIDRLIQGMEKIDPSIQEFMGPGHIASGQGLIRALSERHSMFSVQAEFGHTLKVITDPRANHADLRTRQVLLDIFGKSGEGRKIYSSAYSDTEKNTQVIEAPNFCMLGETTPEKFFKAFDTDLVAEGFLPRFTCFIYDGPRVARNPAANQLPPEALLNRIRDLLAHVLKLKYENKFVHIHADHEAQQMLDAFDKECDKHINNPVVPEGKELWNRAHLKVLRLAALAAVGDVDHATGQLPVVRPYHVEWALGVVRMDLTRMESRISAGEVGEGEITFESHVTKMVRRYLKMNENQRSAYKVPKSIISDQQLIPFTYLRRVLRSLSEFKNHRLGVERAISDAVKDAVRAEVLLQVPATLLEGKGLKGGEVYSPGPQFRF